MLVGPVFSAGSVTSERERETLDLLLTTIITPWQILWGKLVAGLRVSSVLTLFLLWPLLLACVMVSVYWPNLLSVGAYLVIVLLTCLTTAITALFCSVLFKKSSQAMMTTYLIIIVLFCGPLAATFFAETFFPSHPATPVVKQVGMISPFATAFSVPLDIDTDDRSLDRFGQPREPQKDWSIFAGYVLLTIAQNGALLATMVWLFNTRWRVAD